MRRLFLRSCLFLLVTSAPSHASHTIVPDQSATIQIGIDSNADTVLVMPGNYAEVPVANRAVVIRGVVPSGGPPPNYNFFNLPVLGGFSAHPANGGTIQLIDLRIQGTTVIVVDGNGSGGLLNLVHGCRLDSGLSLTGMGYGYVQNCIVFGNCYVTPFRSDVGMNTIVGGTLTVYANGTTVVHDNIVIGPAPVGIVGGEDVLIRNNYVRDCVNGIQVSCALNSGIFGNVVEDCTGSGFSRPGCMSGLGPGLVSGNIARRCAGRGFDLSGIGVQFAGNYVEDSGAEGIFATGTLSSVTNNIVRRTGGAGISVGQAVFGIRGNQVFHARGDGIVTGYTDDVSGNVVGHSGGRGIVVTGELDHFRVRHNTVYLSAGAGFELAQNQAGPPDSVSHNIGYANANGLVWSGGGAPVVGCNDWYANTGAAVLGTTLGATDVAVNPMFCNLAQDVVSLAASSALLDLPGCGLIGALPQGCTVAVTVPAGPVRSLEHLRVSPQPANSIMRFVWEPATTPAQLEIYDVAGARRVSRPLLSGASEFVWLGTDDAGQQVPAGVYFARLGRSDARLQTRVVIVR